MMIPPLSGDSLDANPVFARLWKYVTEEILDRDGSRKTLNQERTKAWREEVAERRRRRRKDEDGEDDDDGRVKSKEGSRLQSSYIIGFDDDDDIEEAETPFGYRDDDGTKNRKKQDPSLEEVLHKTRVEKMRIQVLMDVLRDVAYSADNTSAPIPDSGTVSEKDTTRGGTTHPQPQTHTLSTNQNANMCMNTTTFKDNLLVMTSYLDVVLWQGSRDSDDEKVPVLSRAEQDLLVEDVEVFEQNIPFVAKLVGQRLVEVDQGLGEMISLSNTTDTHTNEHDQDQRHQTNPTEPKKTLVESLRQNQDRSAFLRSSISPRLSTLSETITRLTSLQRDRLADEIRKLEVTKHGVVSRHAQSKTLFLVTVARAMDLKLRLLLVEERKREQNGEATKAKKAVTREKLSQIEREDSEVSRRIEELERLVGEYDSVDDDEHIISGGAGAGGGSVMTRLGKRYGEIEREMEMVKADVEKLQQRSKTKTW